MSGVAFASLGSGSGGNATLVRFGQTQVLVDCGFSMKEAQRRMLRLGSCLSRLDALLVTHEHGDHIKGVAAVARRYAIPVYMTQGTYQSRNLGHIPGLQLIHNYTPFQVGAIQVTPVAVPHDAREPSQYVFTCGERRLGILTDLGSVTPHVLQAYRACNALLVEANHDREMLISGPYPYSLKQRVMGPWGHLSNQQTCDLLAQLDTQSLQYLVVGHISRTNNSVALAQAALAQLQKPLGQIVYACQDDGFDWVQVG